MRTTFDEFSEMMERLFANSWRSAIGRNNQDVIDSVTSTIFIRKVTDEKWSFSFALRIHDVWYQAQHEIDEVQYDPIEPPDVDEYDRSRSLSPQQQASALATDILNEIREKVGCENADYQQ